MCTVTPEEDLAQPAIAAALRGLESLDLGRGRQLTAEGLRHLAALPLLAELKLPSCERIDGAPIGDAGILHLSRCPALRELRLSGARVTADGVAALRRAAPDLRVVAI